MTKLLLLHGALGSRHHLVNLADRCSAWADVSTLEFAGHGSTPDVDAPWTVDVFADQLRQFLLANGPHAVFGYSMGGYITLRVLQQAPELVQHLVTLGTKLEWSPETAARETRMLDADKIEAKVPAFAADLAERHGNERWRAVLASTAGLMVALGNDHIAPSDLAGLSTPVSFMVGDRDEMVSIDETRIFQQAIPGATLAVLPGTRHPIDRADAELVAWNLRYALDR